MPINKYMSSFSSSPEDFNRSIQTKEIEVAKEKIRLRKGTLAERIVCSQISKEKASLVDRILNFILNLFSKEFRVAKKTIKANLIRFRNDYIHDFAAKRFEQTSIDDAQQKPVLEKLNPPISLNKKIRTKIERAERKKEKKAAKELRKQKAIAKRSGWGDRALKTHGLLDMPTKIKAEIFSYLEKDHLQKIRQSCQELKLIHKEPKILASLIGKNTKAFTFQELLHLLKFCGNLIKTLDLFHLRYDLTPQDLDQLLQAYPNLQNLKLSSYSISNDALKKISTLKHLKNLNILGDPEIKELSLGELAPSKLRMLKIIGNYTDNHLKDIEKLDNLQSLILGVHSISEECLEKIGQIETLRELSLPLCEKLTEAGCKAISQLHKLTSFSLSNCDIEDSMLKHFALLKNLKSLSLRSCKKITDDGLASFAKLPLEELDLSDCNLTNQSFETIKTLDKLKNINLTDCKGINNFKNIQLLNNLEQLYLGNCEVTDEDLEAISNLKKLKTLHLYSSEKITDDGVEKISRLSELEELKLSKIKNMTDKSSEHIALLQKLRSLNVSHCTMTDVGMTYIAKLSFLEDLTLCLCDYISNFGVEAILKLNYLKKLDLSGCKNLTDDVVEKIASIPNLTVYLVASKISEEKINFLKQREIIKK